MLPKADNILRVKPPLSLGLHHLRLNIKMRPPPQKKTKKHQYIWVDFGPEQFSPKYEKKYTDNLHVNHF